jgi:hypothetical protein
MSKLYGNGQSRPLVFVGHGYGALVLKQTLINPLSDFSKKLLCNLCGIVFYGAVQHLKTRSTNLKPTEHTKMLDSSQSIEDPLKLITEVLLESSECFEAAVDLSKIKVCIVNQGNSNMQVCKSINICGLECHYFCFYMFHESLSLNYKILHHNTTTVCNKLEITIATNDKMKMP